jgi:hypothetical protein
MRKILLAASAIAGFAAVSAGNANAQMPNQPVVDTSYASNTGNPVGFPAPGTVVVRLQGFLDVLDGVTNDSGTIGKNTSGQTNGNKTGSVLFQSYARIKFGFDGTAANGLQYGSAFETRQNAGFAGGMGGSISGNSLGTTMVMWRQAGYVGTPTLGRVWFGQIDGAIERFMTGTFENYDVVGGWNAITLPAFVNSGTQLSWAFPEDSIFYRTEKLTYLSPSIMGFDFGATFEPNQNTSGTAQCSQATATASQTANLSTGAVSAASPGCPDVASTVTQTIQRKNTFDVVGRYKGSFGPVAVVGTLGYIGSGVVGYGGVAPIAAAKDLSVIDAGATVTVAGLTVGGHYTGGAMNNSDAPIRSGQKDGSNFILGASYTIGTIVVGGNFIDELNAGTGYVNGAGQITNGSHMLHEVGVGLGGSWDYAPGAAAFVSGIWGTRHQSGVDLLNGSSATTHFNNSTRAEALVIGNRFQF